MDAGGVPGLLVTGLWIIYIDNWYRLRWGTHMGLPCIKSYGVHTWAYRVSNPMRLCGCLRVLLWHGCIYFDLSVDIVALRNLGLISG